MSYVCCRRATLSSDAADAAAAPASVLAAAATAAASPPATQIARAASQAAFVKCSARCLLPSMLSQYAPSCNGGGLHEMPPSSFLRFPCVCVPSLSWQIMIAFHKGTKLSITLIIKIKQRCCSHLLGSRWCSSCRKELACTETLSKRAASPGSTCNSKVESVSVAVKVPCVKHHPSLCAFFWRLFVPSLSWQIIALTPVLNCTTEVESSKEREREREREAFYTHLQREPAFLLFLLALAVITHAASREQL